MGNTSAAGFGDATPLQDGRRRTRRAWRTVAYCGAFACLAGVLMSWELGADALTGDEAQYALVVQNIKRSHDWIHVTPYPPTPYFQKPPLYFWLTAATYDLAGGPREIAYRVWSAAAGVGTVVLTCMLGAMLLSPEVGAIAALLVMTNRTFLLVHGARSGSFDALVTFLILAGVVVYWAAAVRRKWSWIGWAGVGVCAGLASLTKPFVGVPLVALLAIHALFVERRTSRGRRVGGVALAVLLLAAVAGPWYAAQWRTYPDFAGEMFGKNLVERFTEGVDDKHVERWYFYAEQLTKSSLPFAASIPTAVFAVVACGRRGPHRSRYALLLLAGAGWVVLFSLSASKAIHYIYPAFPAIALMIAEGTVLLGRFATARATPVARGRLAFGAGVVLLAAFAFQYARTLYMAIPSERSPFVPWEMMRAISPALRGGDARVVFAGFTDRQTEWRSELGLRARDCYYFEQMRADPSRVDWARDSAELSRLLDRRTPALVVVSSRQDPQRWLDELGRQQRLDERFIYRHQGYAVFGVDLKPLLSAAARPGDMNPFVRVEPAATPGVFRLTVTPPATGAVGIATTLRLEGVSPGSAVRFAYVLHHAGGRKTVEDQSAFASRDETLDARVLLEEQLLTSRGPFHLTLTLRDARVASLGPVKSTVDIVRVEVSPSIPPETHPRR